jgi:hypothetical protein
VDHVGNDNRLSVPGIGSQTVSNAYRQQGHDYGNGNDVPSYVGAGKLFQKLFYSHSGANV